MGINIHRKSGQTKQKTSAENKQASNPLTVRVCLFPPATHTNCFIYHINLSHDLKHCSQWHYKGMERSWCKLNKILRKSLQMAPRQKISSTCRHLEQRGLVFIPSSLLVSFSSLLFLLIFKHVLKFLVFLNILLNFCLKTLRKCYP